MENCLGFMTRENIVILVFAGAAIVALLALLVWHRSRDSSVDLTDLLMENGRISRLAVTWLGSFAVMTFGFVYLLLTKALTDMYVGIYTATWAAPIITKLFAVKPVIPDKPDSPMNSASP